MYNITLKQLHTSCAHEVQKSRVNSLGKKQSPWSPVLFAIVIRDGCGMLAGTLDAIVKMIRFEGVTGFYKGMSTKIVQSVVAAAILFMIKEELVKGARALVTKQVKIPKVVPLLKATS